MTTIGDLTAHNEWLATGCATGAFIVQYFQETQGQWLSSYCTELSGRALAAQAMHVHRVQFPATVGFSFFILQHPIVVAMSLYFNLTLVDTTTACMFSTMQLCLHALRVTWVISMCEIDTSSGDRYKASFPGLHQLMFCIFPTYILWLVHTTITITCHLQYGTTTTSKSPQNY